MIPEDWIQTTLITMRMITNKEGSTKGLNICERRYNDEYK